MNPNSSPNQTPLLARLIPSPGWLRSDILATTTVGQVLELGKVAAIVELEKPKPQRRRTKATK